MWRATVLTLFPEMFPGPLGISLVGKALGESLWNLDVRDIREHGLGRHRSVDDTPAGGGPGMVMRADVAVAAIDAALAGDEGTRPLIYLSPRGAPLTQARVRSLAAGSGTLLFCGRFEGLDERAIRARGLEEVSLGDFVLSGGEIAAMALIEACVRLLPGVMGAQTSGTEESFEQGLLEYPHYTRPQSFEDMDIPPVLTSGNHAQIARWRRLEAERLTKQRRPDLWSLYEKVLRSARRPATPEPGSAKGLPKDTENEPDPDA
jgi:tRNA (guanine37-N1)-methyltransferase